jgi:hypothetical protein
LGRDDAVRKRASNSTQHTSDRKGWLWLVQLQAWIPRANDHFLGCSMFVVAVGPVAVI